MILVRRGGKHADRALEVLLARRNLEARFMPGVWVFPGGAIDDADFGAEGDDELDADEHAHRVCAVREVAEEVGITLPDPGALVPFARWITPEELSLIHI